eukprot:TRINITY_DN7149_c0_g1_i1.p1 TRINITY_DN7149_c0_g1~~TRINITY_DN7149_c0_g1_i1.p1  ORF type:complete len:656 (+),score=120.39 TRINITY_DN7149_c0_g1_i1:72-2039(+)
MTVTQHSVSFEPSQYYPSQINGGSVEMVETNQMGIYQDTSTISAIGDPYQRQGTPVGSIPAVYFGETPNNESIQRKKYTQKEIEDIYHDRSKIPARAMAAMVALCCMIGVVGLAIIITWRLQDDEDDHTCNGICEVNYNSFTRDCNGGSGCCADTYVAVSQLVRGTCTDRDQDFLLGIGIAMVVIAVIVPMLVHFCKEKIFGDFKETFDFTAAAGIPTTPRHDTSFRNTAPLTLLLSGHKSINGTYQIRPGDLDNGYPVWATPDGRVLSSTHSGSWIITLNSDKIAQSISHHGRYPDQLTDPLTWQVMVGESWIPIDELNIIQAYGVGEGVEVQLNQTPAEWVGCTILEVIKGKEATDVHYRIKINQTERYDNAYGYSNIVWPKEVPPTLLRRVASRSVSPSRAIRTPPRTEPVFEAKNIIIRDTQHNNSIQVTVVQQSRPEQAMSAMLKRLKLEGDYSLIDTNMKPVELSFAAVEDGCSYNLCDLQQLHKDGVDELETVATSEGTAADGKTLPVVITPQGLLSKQERHLPRGRSEETVEDVGITSTRSSSSVNSKIDHQFGHPDISAPIYAPPNTSSSQQQQQLPPINGGYRSRYAPDGSTRRLVPRRSTIEIPSNSIPRDDISERESTTNSSVRRDQVMDLQARIEERLRSKA